MHPRVEKLLKLPLYQKMLIFFGTLVVLAGLIIWFLIVPKHQELAQLRQKHQQLQAKLQEDQRIADNLPMFKAEYEKMKEQLTAALTELPNEKEIPALLTSIASLANDNGLDVLRFKPGSEVPKGFYAEVPVELKLTGSYHQVAMFCNAVADLSRIVNINNLSLGGAKKAEGVTNLSVDCLVTTFRFIEEKAAVAKGKGGKKK